MAESLQKLECAIEYSFREKKLLEQALRHRSVGGQSNERLEFLGDGVLNFVIAADLYERYKTMSEGELSKLRASLVRRETLAALAQELNIGSFLALGIGEQRSGGWQRTSILADAMEAIIGAIYIDGGFIECQKVLLKFFENRLEHLSLDNIKDAKTELQEFLQAHKFDLPIYELVATEGKAHEQVFIIDVSVPGLELSASGKGSSRQNAEKEAAKLFLQKLRNTKFKKVK